ncbi:retrotransposon gag domain-containing protein, partial [Salmonella enterica]|nr:retrotransposon gag domain-containing protein [Salmonella enterica]
SFASHIRTTAETSMPQHTSYNPLYDIPVGQYPFPSFKEGQIPQLPMASQAGASYFKPEFSKIPFAVPNLDDPEVKNELATPSNEKLEVLEERLRAVEGTSVFGNMDATQLCLVPDVVIPPKFKLPEFEKYDGTTCPKSHIVMYCRKMAAHVHNDKLLIHCFQDSLKGPAARWYMQLDSSHVVTWKNLADSFLKQYKHNIDLAPDRLDLQRMEKKSTEDFKDYAQRWRDTAAQVQPPLTDNELSVMFINTLRSPFYEHMVGSASTNFSDIMTIGERIEYGIKHGRIAKTAESSSTKKSNTSKKKEGEVQMIGKVDKSHRQIHQPITQYPSNYLPTYGYYPHQVNNASASTPHFMAKIPDPK